MLVLFNEDIQKGVGAFLLYHVHYPVSLLALRAGMCLAKRGLWFRYIFAATSVLSGHIASFE